MAGQGEIAIETVDELAVGHRQEECEHRAEVQGQERAEQGRFSEETEGQTACAGDEEDQDETDLHAAKPLGAKFIHAGLLGPEQAERPDRQPDAARDTQQGGAAVPCIGSGPPEDVVIKGGERCRGKAQQKACLLYTSPSPRD